MQGILRMPKPDILAITVAGCDMPRCRGRRYTTGAEGRCASGLLIEWALVRGIKSGPRPIEHESS